MEENAFPLCLNLGNIFFQTVASNLVKTVWWAMNIKTMKWNRTENVLPITWVST